MNLAYFTTMYPSVSHTFIRREIREMERRGHKVLRLALRPSQSPLADPLDLEELSKTIFCLSQSIFLILWSIGRMVFLKFRLFAKALSLTVKMSRKSSKGILKHLAYLLEACILLRILEKNSIKHLHVHFGTNVTTVARLIKYCGGPNYSFTVHGPAEFDAPLEFDLRGKIKDSTFVVAITDFCASQLKRWSSFEDWNKIKTVHCALDDSFFNSYSPIESTEQIFVSVGRLSTQKGFTLLIDAFQKVIQHEGFHDSQLIIVGDGELKEKLEYQIKRAGLNNNVTITGFVSEMKVREYIKSARLFVLPSFAEGLPMVIMESYAVGRPVLSTYIAGIPELIENERNGWLIPAGNCKKLKEAMIYGMGRTNKELNEMAGRGHKLTRERHSISVECAKLEKLFQEQNGG